MATTGRVPLLSGFFFWLAVLAHSKPTAIDISNQGDGKGDIVQLWSLINTAGEEDVMRNALKSNSPSRWTTKKDSKGHYIIPFTVRGKFTKEEKRTIGRAMGSIAQNSCVKFQHRTRERDFVELTNRRGEGCYTMVGKTRGKNVVNLESNEMATCLLFPTVIHELLHVVGLWHEQMRYDRDKYIKIHYENVAPILRAQFEKISSGMSTTYGVAYDYRSVMHYRKDAFTRNGRPTMQTKQTKFQNVIGNARTASTGDWRKVCAIYRCNKCMKKTRAPPQNNDGMQHEGGELGWFESLFDKLHRMNGPMTPRDNVPNAEVPIPEGSSVETNASDDDVNADNNEKVGDASYATSDNDADFLLNESSLMEVEPLEQSNEPRDSREDTSNHGIYDADPLQTIDVWDKDPIE